MMNKKRLIYFILCISIFLFIGLYLILNYQNANILDSEDKKWLNDNSGKVIDIDIINDIPIYSNNGKGVVFDFLNYVSSETGLEFNKIPYLKGSDNYKSSYKMEIIDASNTISNNQLLLFNDFYIAIEKQERKVDSIYDLEGLTLGVLGEDSSLISYYLENVPSVKLNSCEDIKKLFASLNDGEVNMILLPYTLYLDLTINSDYYINYFFTNLSKAVVLTMGDSAELNNIIRKAYSKWFSEEYISDYNKLLLDYYIDVKNINDKAKADLLSKTYVYGYVENYPYEFSLAGHMEGVAIEYIKRIIRLTDLDVSYKKYASIDELKNGIKNGEVDIYFDYFNGADSKYLKTKSVFIENYVVIGSGNKYVVDNLESLKGKNVALLDNSYLNDYIKANSKANVTSKNNVKELVEYDLLVMDKEIYSYYRNDLFKDYDILYSSVMSNDYTFMVKSNNELFYKLFNYFINTNSYYNYRNNAFANFKVNLFDSITFEELYLIILAVILIPILIFISIVVFIRNKHKLRLIKRDDRKKYTDLMTSLKNRNYLNLSIEKWNENRVYPQSIIVIDLNNIKYINDNYGREKGDALIVRAASVLINTQLENSEIIRSDGNEFIIYMIGYNENQVEIYTKKLSKSLSELPYGFGAALGYSMILDSIKTVDDAINEATLAMQNDKELEKW